MRFDLEIVSGCARRCRFGKVQVIVCKPISQTGRLFPTNFWLMCPHLIHRAGMIESQQGVHELEDWMTKRKFFHQWRKYNIAHQTLRLSQINTHQLSFIRKYHKGIFRHLIGTGIGGMKYTDIITVKCLHLQTASYLAMRYHPAEEWLISKGLCGECQTCMCT